METISEQNNEKCDAETAHSKTCTEKKANGNSREKANEFKRSNGNHYVEVTLDEGNNNVENREDIKKKDSVRRARFSSEITIQPKAYFQSGTETVIMMVRIQFWINVSKLFFKMWWFIYSYFSPQTPRRLTMYSTRTSPSIHSTLYQVPQTFHKFLNL